MKNRRPLPVRTPSLTPTRSSRDRPGTVSSTLRVVRCTDSERSDGRMVFTRFFFFVFSSVNIFPCTRSGPIVERLGKSSESGRRWYLKRFSKFSLVLEFYTP